MGAALSRYDDWLSFLTVLPQRVPALEVVVVNGSAVTGGWNENCPARHDFGLRYLRTDLPAGMAVRVEALLPGPDLTVRSRAAFAWQDEVLVQLT